MLPDNVLVSSFGEGTGWVKAGRALGLRGTQVSTAGFGALSEAYLPKNLPTEKQKKT